MTNLFSSAIFFFFFEGGVADVNVKTVLSSIQKHFTVIEFSHGVSSIFKLSTYFCSFLWVPEIKT